MSTPSKSRKSNLPTAGAQRIQAIVRKLPPNLPEELFWRSCELWVNENTVKERWFMKGALKGPRFSSSSLLSRAYIAFKSPEELATFSQNYDGHIFRDKQGNEFSAVVEFAPSQKLPLANPKVDPRQGTIEDDEDYKSFLALLEKGENPSKEKATTQIIAGKLAIHPSKPDSTPLLEALITSKKNVSSSAQGGKFSKHKPQHQHASVSKPQTKEDDAHFSRAQPIVPSGPVTLLTAAKPESSSKAGVPTPNNPTLSPALSTKMTIQTKETGAKGKGKGKPAAAGEQPQEPQSKPGKGKNTPKKQAPSNDAPTPNNAPGLVGEGSSKPKDEVSRKTPPPSKKKKPSPSPGGDSTQNKSKGPGGGTGEKANDGQSATGARERGRGRGRGGGGRGRVVIVPKILTKIISEGSAATATAKSGPPPSATTTATSTSEAPDSPPVVRTSQAGGQPMSSASEPAARASTTDAQTAGGQGVADNDNENGPALQSAPSSRGGERGRRPFYRGRGRGRGRGAARGGAVSVAS